MATTLIAGEVGGLEAAFEEQRERLLPCVHCGFCLPACPTYIRLGDEADSPRGRLHLMKAVVEGRLDPGSEAFRTHIDRCLGCRACEPVCPSGVEYGTLLELARYTAARHVPQDFLTRTLLTVVGSRTLRRGAFFLGRVLRRSGIATLGAKVLPSVGFLRSMRLGMAMLASSAPWHPRVQAAEPAKSDQKKSGTGRIGLLVGCVQEGLYSHVNEATARTLEANGYEVVAVAEQDCCGALHAHGGDLEAARGLARQNVDAFINAQVDYVAVNAAGCGAAMKDYDTLLSSDRDYAELAGEFSERVRDVTELLAEVGPRSGAQVACTVAYDHPCHLLHAQGVESAPLRVLEAVPGVDVRVVEGADECCGGAGIYGITHPDLGGRIGGDKVDAVCRMNADAVATANPGCMMQIGAGLRLRGASEGVLHPVELLDVSYRRAGFYEGAVGRP